MSRQEINTGVVINDGTGDKLRVAFSKTNNNFVEIYNSANAIGNIANTGLVNAVSAFNQANAAFTRANTKITLSTPVLQNITGPIAVQSNLYSGTGNTHHIYYDSYYSDFIIRTVGDTEGISLTWNNSFDSNDPTYPCGIYVNKGYAGVYTQNSFIDVYDQGDSYIGFTVSPYYNAFKILSNGDIQVTTGGIIFNDGSYQTIAGGGSGLANVNGTVFNGSLGIGNTTFDSIMGLTAVTIGGATTFGELLIYDNTGKASLDTYYSTNFKSPSIDLYGPASSITAYDDWVNYNTLGDSVAQLRLYPNTNYGGSTSNARFEFAFGLLGGYPSYVTINNDGNVYINRTDSIVGQGVKLDVAGAINASAILINGADNAFLANADGVVFTQGYIGFGNTPVTWGGSYQGITIGGQGRNANFDMMYSTGDIALDFYCEYAPGRNYWNSLGNTYFGLYAKADYSALLASLELDSTSNSMIYSINDQGTGLKEKIRFDKTGNVLLGRVTSTIGNGVLLDIAGSVNAVSYISTGNVVVGKTTDSTVGKGMKLDVAGGISSTGNVNAAIFQVASYTVAGVPSASPAGQIVYVSNETGGATIAFSDGTNWRRVADRAIIA